MSSTVWGRMKTAARELKGLTLVVYFAARDPRTPWWLKALALLVAAYALSPIDLIPDFIPVLGYLDDIILLPLGIALVIRWLPDDVLARARLRASEMKDRPVNYTVGALIVLIWVALLAVSGYWAYLVWDNQSL